LPWKCNHTYASIKPEKSQLYAGQKTARFRQESSTGLPILLDSLRVLVNYRCRKQHRSLTLGMLFAGILPANSHSKAGNKLE
jgi:hypothetical protein